MQHIGKEAAIRFLRIVLSPEEMDARNVRLVITDPLQHLLRRFHLPQRRTQTVAQGFDLADILPQNHSSCQLKCIANALRFDEWIAVPISPDPGAELNQIGHVRFVESHPINIAKRFDDFIVNSRQRGEQ